MTYTEFEIKYFNELDSIPADYRKGQWLFNDLYEINPILANKIRNTEVDCFYNDRRIPKTLEYAKQHWNGL